MSCLEQGLALAAKYFDSKCCSQYEIQSLQAAKNAEKDCPKRHVMPSLWSNHDKLQQTTSEANPNGEERYQRCQVSPCFSTPGPLVPVLNHSNQKLLSPTQTLLLPIQQVWGPVIACFLLRGW